MNERIEELRKALGLTMEKFGERLGVGKTTISNLKNGGNVTDQMFKSICREFNVNPEWLRTGAGEMFSISENETKQKIIELLDDIPDYKMKYVLAYVQGITAGESCEETAK